MTILNSQTKMTKLVKKWLFQIKSGSHTELAEYISKGQKCIF